mmetsp:Transcript_45127/g.125534  ORF Transcript_45127/g.125534 Transcript_45127/m.125534 type:complete len:113 (-) Transcript_45127:72-410(-)
MAEYFVRNTFIDVPSPLAEAPRVRASGAPPGGAPSQDRAAHAGESQSEALTAAALRPLPPNRGFEESERNIGSVGHPELCGRCGKEKKMDKQTPRCSPRWPAGPASPSACRC